MISRVDFDDFSIVKDTDADETVEADVLGGPCRVTDIYTEGVAAASYLKFYDDIAPIVGTTIPDYVIEIPASGTLARAAFPLFGKPLEFSEGLSFACVTTGGTAGDTGPTGSVVVVLGLKKGVS